MHAEVNLEDVVSVNGRPTRIRTYPRKYEDYYFLGLLSWVDRDVPVSYEKAMNSIYAEEWKKATEKEMDAMKRNKVWKEVD